MREIYLNLEEEILELGVEKLLEPQYIIKKTDSYKNLNATELLLTDKNIIRDYTIILFNSMEIALYSQAKIKLLKGVSRKELLEAVKVLMYNGDYVQEKIKSEEENLQKIESNIMKLNHRHRQLVSKILEGKTNREIAVDLFLSEKTIKNNLTELYKILSVKNRIELIKKCKKSD
ncbi:LuxR C-terminal-related transcriptional regulator [Anaerosphaera multitolerans]|uniref:DNA-binding response regulator n=1 Tax=Anaerosphaera multitolerans TaxID=2487351 RepID=A0A437S4U2_9FIRM|nr:LuxR C-terminal-related transcriptional regulator [Anaerosphaera multitolerans]RVU54029.1 DNA-binding response regulator [Anaerosphaera multitolerans]